MLASLPPTAPPGVPTCAAPVPASQRGSTLIELMVGLAILALLTSLAVPGIASLARSHHVRTAADAVVHGADLARAYSVSNRRAYGLVFIGLGAPGAGLKLSVVQGTGTACSTLGGGKLIYSADYSKGNPLGEPPVAISAFAPAELSNGAAFVCFKPDGRVLRADTGRPFNPPAGTTFAAGSVIVELRRLSDSGESIGNALQVQIGYNGAARIVFGLPLGQLQGAGP